MLSFQCIAMVFSYETWHDRVLIIANNGLETGHMQRPEDWVLLFTSYIVICTAVRELLEHRLVPVNLLQSCKTRCYEKPFTLPAGLLLFFDTMKVPSSKIPTLSHAVHPSCNAQSLLGIINRRAPSRLNPYTYEVSMSHPQAPNISAFPASPLRP